MSRGDENTDKILAEMEGCSRRIRENMQTILLSATRIGMEAVKMNFILEKFKRALNETQKEGGKDENEH